MRCQLFYYVGLEQSLASTPNDYKTVTAHIPNLNYDQSSIYFGGNQCTTLNVCHYLSFILRDTCIIIYFIHEYSKKDIFSRIVFSARTENRTRRGAFKQANEEVTYKAFEY